MKSVVFGDQTEESERSSRKNEPWLKTQVYLSRNVSSSHIEFIQYSGIRAWCKLSRLILDFDKLAVRQLHVEPEGNRETKPVETIAGERVETWWVYHVPQLFWGTIPNMPPSCKLHFVTSKMGPNLKRWNATAPCHIHFQVPHIEVPRGLSQSMSYPWSTLDGADGGSFRKKMVPIQVQKKKHGPHATKRN